jgi:hypothetical protein
MWAAVLFFASLVLLAGFGGLKAVTGSLPTAWRHVLAVFLHDTTHRTVVFLVEALRAVERPLTRISFRMRIQKSSVGGKGISPFLKSIVPEKKIPPGDGTTSGDKV